MKFGVLTTASTRIGAPPIEGYKRFLRLAQEAERAGFDAIWTTEHHFGSDPAYRPFGLSEEEYPPTDYDLAADPFTLLTWVAAHTTTIKLGTGLALPHWDHPVRLVERAAMLDVLSGGRLELGLGRGIGFRETETFGAPTDEGSNARKFREAVELINLAWRGETFSFDGEFFRARDLILAPRPTTSRAPLYLGSVSSGSAAYAGGKGYSYMSATWPHSTSDALREKRLAFEQAASDAGHDPTSSSNPHMYLAHCAATDEQAVSEAREYLRQYQYINEAHYEFSRRAGTSSADSTVQSSYTSGDGESPLEIQHRLVEQAIDEQLIGSVDRVAGRIEQLNREVGIDSFVLNVGWGLMPEEMAVRSLRTFAGSVLPRFSDQFASAA